MFGHKEILVRRCLVLGLAMLFRVALAPAVVAGDSGPAKDGNQIASANNPNNQV